MLDIIGVGESDIDIYLRADHPPARGGKVRAEEIGRFPGGMIGNFCSAAARLGMRCGIVSALGDDENGRQALRDYRERGIDTAGLAVKAGGQTFYCVVHVDASGEKSLTAVVTDLISPALKDIDFSYVRSASRVHLNSMDRRLAVHVADNIGPGPRRLSLDYEEHADGPGFDSWRGVLEKRRSCS